MKPKSRQEIDTEILDFSFYLIQRGESGHKSGCKQKHKCSKGVNTIGYGTAIDPGHTFINYSEETIDERTAIFLARAEMHTKLYERCRKAFPTGAGRMEYACFDTMLPCHQAVIVDLAYQGNLTTEIIDAIKKNDIVTAIAIVSSNDNKERAAVRGRALFMGSLIRMYRDLYPSKPPQVAAREITQEFITLYKDVKGDEELTRDEIALLYRSCMAEYKVPVTQKQIENFANSYPQIAVGQQGIGDKNRLDPKHLVSEEEALKYTTPPNHGNNPRDGFNKSLKKSVQFKTLAEGYAALVSRLQDLAQKGSYTPQELWAAFTGVEDVSGIPLMECVREKGVWLEENKKIDLSDPQVFEAVALSISEINNGGYPLGGKEAAVAYIGAAAGYDPTKIKRLRYKSTSFGVLARTPAVISRDFDLETMAPAATTIEKKWKAAIQYMEEKDSEAKKEEARQAKKNPKPSTLATQYRETAPSSKNEFNNPGRICSKGKPIKYKTLREGYEKLTETLYKNQHNRTCKEIVKRFMGGSEAHAKKMLVYMKELGVDIKDINTPLDLKDPRVLEALTLSLTKLRHKGKVLGGDNYATQCVTRKVSKLLQNDGVTVNVKAPSVDAKRSLAAAGQVVQPDVSWVSPSLTRELG